MEKFKLIIIGAGLGLLILCVGVMIHEKEWQGILFFLGLALLLASFI